VVYFIAGKVRYTKKSLAAQRAMRRLVFRGGLRLTIRAGD
jgi:hypothetical protein